MCLLSAGYVSSPDNVQCFDSAADLRHYVHCINEWVSASPSKIRIECLDELTAVPGIVPKDADKDVNKDVPKDHDSFDERIEKLNNQLHLDIDPRALN